MREIHGTTQLESHQSTYRIHLVKHINGSLYIEIVQALYGDNNSEQSIRINPSILSELIQVLQKYHSKILCKNVQNAPSELDQELIQNYYFKGVPLKNLSMIFSRSEEVIEMVLRNRGIAIVSNELPRARYRRRRKKRY